MDPDFFGPAWSFRRVVKCKILVTKKKNLAKNRCDGRAEFLHAESAASHVSCRHRRSDGHCRRHGWCENCVSRIHKACRATRAGGRTWGWAKNYRRHQSNWRIWMGHQNHVGVISVDMNLFYFEISKIELQTRFPLWLYCSLLAVKVYIHLAVSVHVWLFQYVYEYTKLAVSVHQNCHHRMQASEVEYSGHKTKYAGLLSSILLNFQREQKEWAWC